MSTRRPPTLRDVAARAGVHPATVSRSLNRPEVVAAPTLRAVREAVEALGFVPNRSARHLVSGRADAVGVLVPDIGNPYFAAIVKAIQDEARADDLAVLVADTAGRRDEERQAVAALARRVDGLVAITPLAEASDPPVPVVSVNRRSRSGVSVVVDQTAIVEIAIGHLLGLGHRRIAILRGPAGYWSATRRDRAVRAWPTEGGVELVLLGPFPPTIEGGRAAHGATAGSRATAVVAFNDVQAAGLIAAATAAGRSVPGDLSVVGSDGLDITEVTSPPLTTVAAPLDELGRTALRRLLDLRGSTEGPATTTLRPSLVQRASTAPPTP